VGHVLKETVGVKTMPAVGSETIIDTVEVFNTNRASGVHFLKGYIVLKGGGKYIT
jgi:hypothetical protein